MSETHPEDFCEKCGRENICWYTPSPLWNKYAKDQGILCPCCFAKLAAEQPYAWKLVPQFYDESALTTAEQRADHYRQKSDMLSDAAFRSEERAEKAEQQLAAAKRDADMYLGAIFDIADDGWLCHGPEGMSETQQKIYAFVQQHPEYKRRAAIDALAGGEKE